MTLAMSGEPHLRFRGHDGNWYLGHIQTAPKISMDQTIILLVGGLYTSQYCLCSGERYTRGTVSESYVSVITAIRQTVMTFPCDLAVRYASQNSPLESCREIYVDTTHTLGEWGRRPL